MKLGFIRTFFTGIEVKYILILLPFWLEFIDNKRYSINIPGFPYSVGIVFLIINGILRFNLNKDLKNPIVKALMIILFGTLVGSFFGDFVLESFSRSAGQLPIYISIFGISYYLEDRYYKNILDLIFIISFCKWSLYVIGFTLKNGQNFSYEESFLANESINHHIPGLFITISAIYLINRFCIKSNKYTFAGYLIFIFGLLMCVLLASRSNMLFLLSTFILGIYFLKRKIIRFSIVMVVLITIINFGFNYLFSDLDYIQERFDTSNTEYLEKTNRGRVSVYEMGLPQILNNPFGRGITDVYVDIGNGSKLLMHNQYATFIIAGGFIAIYGVFLLLSAFLKISINVLKTFLILTILR